MCDDDVCDDDVCVCVMVIQTSKVAVTVSDAVMFYQVCHPGHGPMEQVNACIMHSHTPSHTPYTVALVL